MSDYNACKLLPSGNIRTPRGKLSFPHLLMPRSNDKNPSAAPKYQVAFIIPNTSDITLLKEAAEKAARERWGDKLPGKMRNPLMTCGVDGVGRKGKNYPDEFDDWVMIRCNSTLKPDIIDGAFNRVEESREIYPGRWAMLSVRAFAYDNESVGVSFGLQNVQLLEHDTPLAGSASRAEDEFERVSPSDSGAGTATASSVFG